VIFVTVQYSMSVVYRLRDIIGGVYEYVRDRDGQSVVHNDTADHFLFVSNCTLAIVFRSLRDAVTF